MKHLVICIALLTVGACCFAQQEKVASHKATSGNPVFQGWYADPEGIIYDDTYWIFPTWSDLYENQTQESFGKFWEDYSSAEKTIYQSLLSDISVKMSGTIKEQTEKLGVDQVLFTGFLDGINDSLNTRVELEDMTEDSAFELDIDFEKLYFNMLDAKADYLYTLPEWDSILTDEKRAEIEKAYKRSKTVVKEPKIGRNDPCPCGSGKKYKKCCGKNV